MPIVQAAIPAGVNGTGYVISNAGPKFYPPSSPYDHLMAKTGSRAMLFQSIRVDNNTLQYTACTFTNKVYDAFEIHKQPCLINPLGRFKAEPVPPHELGGAGNGCAVK